MQSPLLLPARQKPRAVGTSLVVLLLVFFLVLGQGLKAQPPINPKVWEEMLAFNKAMKSDRLVVSIQDTIVGDQLFQGKPADKYPLYSITKVFSGIAIGLLIDQKKISHTEIPLAVFFPEWQEDSLKKKITIRHLLQHSSGLSANPGSQDIYPQADFVQFALQAPVVTPPGEVFFYNNKAFNLLSGIVQKVSGKTLELFLKENLFQPLGISDYSWRQDAAGHSWGMDGLWMNANDLTKVGQLLCNQGEWQGQRILSSHWCQLMLQVPLVNAMQGKYGYAMAIRSLPFQETMAITTATIDTLQLLGLSAEWVQRLRSLHAQAPFNYLDLGKALKEKFTLAEMEALTAFACRHGVPLYTVTNNNYYFKHGGEFGMLLAAYPKRKKVMVRYLGEKWGRKMKEDGSGYKYLVDDELINFLLQL